MWIQSLLGQLRNSECSVLLRTTRGQWRKARHEEVQTWEWHEVDSNLAQVTIQLPRETQTAGHTTHGSRHQMVQVTVGWGGQLQCTETDIVQSFIVQQEWLIRVFHQLMEAQDCLGHMLQYDAIKRYRISGLSTLYRRNWQICSFTWKKARCIVWFHHGVRHLGWRDHGECLHDASVAEWILIDADSVWILKVMKSLQGNLKTNNKKETVGIGTPQKKIQRLQNAATEMRSGYSSRTLEINNVPMPAPVPPPREWQSWKPCKPELLVDLTFNNEKTWKFCTIWSDMIDHKHQTKRKNIIYSIKTCARYNHIPLLPFWQRQERCRSTRRLQCSGPDMAGQFSTSNMKINGAALDKTMEPS